MNKSEAINEIGALLLRCEDVVENPWDSFTLVYDIADGHTANSGFLYHGDKIRPFSARISEEPLLLSDTFLAFRQSIFEETGYKVKQFLIQMESKTKRIKLDFEFDDGNRWTIKPAKIKEMREAMRPNFDS